MGSNSNERIQKKLKHENKQLNEEKKITKITNEKEREKNQQGKKLCSAK